MFIFQANFSKRELKRILKVYKWHCFVCEPADLHELQEQLAVWEEDQKWCTSQGLPYGASAEPEPESASSSSSSADDSKAKRKGRPKTKDGSKKSKPSAASSSSSLSA